MTLTSLENAFKSAGHDIKVAAVAIEGAAAKIAGESSVIEPIVNGVLEEVDPAAVPFAEAGEALVGKVCAAIAAMGVASAAKGLTLSLDQAAMADLIAIYNALKGKAAVTTAAAASTAAK